LAAQPVWGQDAPCSQCGPGSQWIRTCGPGQDEVDDHSVRAGIDLNPGGDCKADISAFLEPCPAPDDVLVVDRSGPRDDSARFPGLRAVDGVLDVIDTEIVSMCLRNEDHSVTYRAGAGTGQGPQGANLRASYGAIAEEAGDDEVGESAFEVFFEIEIVVGMGPPTYLYNHAPLRMEQNITCVPPETVYDAFQTDDCLPLFNDPDPGQGEWIADASSNAQHRLFPPRPALPGWAGITLAGLLVVSGRYVFGRRRHAGT